LTTPSCPSCSHAIGWRAALRQVFGPSRAGTALWGVVCPACGADLKVPNGRMLLIAASGLFFGSQSSTLLLTAGLAPWQFWLLKLGMVLGFYAIAIVVFLRLEPVE
jgi:hypothetical protein